MVESLIEILLVEDTPADIQLALYVLTKNNISDNVYVVRDGVEALEFLFCTERYATRQFENQPKVIFLDLQLPLLSGLEVLRLIKADPRTCGIPVIALSSSDMDHDVHESYRLGVNSYVVKPIDFKQFCETIKNVSLYWLSYNRATQPHST